MARPGSLLPTDGELKILTFLWNAGPSELRDVVDAIRRGKAAATTTVATMLKVMESKGLVTREPIRRSRGSTWESAVGPLSTRSGLLHHLINVGFEGSVRLLGTHLIEDKTFSDADRLSIRASLDEWATPDGIVGESIH